MKRSHLLVLVSFPLWLAGCKNGVEKVDFSVFSNQASYAAQSPVPRLRVARINGWLRSGYNRYGARNLTIKESTDPNTLSAADISFIYLVDQMYGLPAQVSYVSGNTYYVGNGFRIINSSQGVEIAWDAYLNCTFIKINSSSEACNIRVSYRYYSN